MMHRTWHIVRFFHSATARLALSYLVIIMLLSIGFSAVFYSTSAHELDVQTEPATSMPSGHATPKRETTFAVSHEGTELTLLSRRTAQLKMNLLRGLVLFNAGTLVFGGVLSYYLARRTLRPIEATMDAQARFSSDASHELRTPLAALRARNEVALRNPDLTVAEAKGVMRSSVEQAVKLEGLSQGLLRLSKEEARQLATIPIRLEEAANEAMNQTVKSAQARRISIHETVADISVMGDMQSVTQVVTILLDNAIKYSQAGSEIYIEGGGDGKYGFLSVRDEGAGIAEGDLPHIFERFYRADHSRTKDGYGLGLPIAQKIVDRHHGSIAVKSTPGKGTTFTVRLPLAKP